MKKLLLAGLIAVSAFMCIVEANAAIPKPKTVWEIKAKKNVVRELVGDQGQFVWIRDDDEVKVFDGIKGGKLWEGTLKGFNEDGYYQLLNTDSPKPLYVYSVKKGLKCIDIATGKEVWETQLEIKTKKFLRSYSTENGFLMEFDTDEQHYILLNLADGKVIWEHSKSEGFTPYPKYVEKGLPVIWTFGDRILMVMKKKVSLIDAKTGAELWKAEKRWPSDAWGDNAIQEQDGKLLLFFEEGVGSVRLSDGKELWYREGEVEEANKSFVLDTPEGKLGLFAFKDALLCYKVDDGTILWEHKKDMSESDRIIGTIEEVYSVPGDDRLKLFMSFRSSLNPFKQKEMGGWITANGVDWKTGKVVYKTV
ncbi:MAG: PQQ-like beta-propeller repeat protein, partial [bacterium]|nr:PQQ-like beta-propeller repeat protein [bacterium]